jgi:hypothetical protein
VRGTVSFPLGVKRRIQRGKRPVHVEGHAAHVQHLLHRGAFAERRVGHIAYRAVNRDPILKPVGIHDRVPHALDGRLDIDLCVDRTHDAQTLTAQVRRASQQAPAHRPPGLVSRSPGCRDGQNRERPGICATFVPETKSSRFLQVFRQM